MPSFDVVSKLEWSEVQNALNQAQKELTQRYDFKGTGANIEKSENSFIIVANADDRARAAFEILQDKLVRRGVSLKHFKAGSPGPGPKGNRKLVISVQEGIDKEKAKVIIKHIKDSKLKVQVAIAEDTVRVTGKKRDDLQAVIANLKAQDFDVSLQFVNFRN